MSGSSLEALASEARACTHCADRLPLGPNPILQVHPDARILIASQAPGRIAHRSGIPFRDASGRRLREWMGLGEDRFYDPRNVAILPIGFCYPGRGAGGDLPPRPECAPLWREAFLERLTGIRLTLLIGAHAQRWHLETGHGRVAERARQWLLKPDRSVPLPHPSPRNNGWLQRHPWFEAELIPKLRATIAGTLRR